MPSSTSRSTPPRPRRPPPVPSSSSSSSILASSMLAGSPAAVGPSSFFFFLRPFLRVGGRFAQDPSEAAAKNRGAPMTRTRTHAERKGPACRRYRIPSFRSVKVSKWIRASFDGEEFGKIEIARRRPMLKQGRDERNVKRGVGCLLQDPLERSGERIRPPEREELMRLKHALKEVVPPPRGDDGEHALWFCSCLSRMLCRRNSQWPMPSPSTVKRSSSMISTQ